MADVLVLRHVPHEHPGTLTGVLTAAGFRVRMVDLFLPDMGVPAMGDAAALVVMGGPMNVDETDRYPFLVSEVRLIQEAVERARPVLGICLGSQLIAKALGERVYPNGQKEIGWYPLSLTNAGVQDPVLGHLRRREWVFQWHGDTFDLPANAAHLASSARCRNQAFRYGTNVYGLQFHLEVTPAMIAEWLAEPANAAELAALDGLVHPEAVQAAATHRCGALEQAAARVFTAWSRLARPE